MRPSPPRPGLTAWLGSALLIGASSSAMAWSAGQITLGRHLLTSVPMLYFLFICVHDGVHGVLHRSRRLSDGLGWLFAAAAGLPFPLLRGAHLRHHRAAGQDRDPERIIYGASLPGLLLRLPLVPLYYLRELRYLRAGARLSVAAHLLGWALLVAASGRPLVLGWLLPVGIAVIWFGFTTVYAPHSRHSERLMRWLNVHSGYHWDHHRDPRYPFHQYFQLRLHNLRRHGVRPSWRHEERVLAALTTELPGLTGPGARPGSGSPSGS